MKIFIAVGTQKFQFDRLLSCIDRLVNASKNYEATAQIGNSNYLPQNYSFKRFMSKEDFESAITQSDVVVTHGGVGTIIQALKKEKRVVVMPRLKKYGEHIDDHQTQIAESFSNQSFVVMYKDGESDIEECINEALKLQLRKYKSNHDFFIKVVDSYISSIEEQ